MRRMILITLLLVVPLACFAQDAVTKASPKQPLQFIIKSDKEVYKLGEEIEIEVELKNIGKGSISINKYIIPGATIEFLISDPLDRHIFCRPTNVIYYEEPFWLFPQNEDFIELKENDVIRETIPIRIEKKDEFFNYSPIKGTFKVLVRHKNYGKANEKTGKENILYELFSNTITIKIDSEIVSFTLNEAKELSKRELKRRGYPVEDMRITADEKNTAWREFIADPSVLQRQIVKRLNLEERNYWTIYFAPKKPMKGGDAWVFVDKNNGKIIGVILGE